MHVLVVVILLLIVSVRQYLHLQISRRVKSSERQLAAMLSMFSAVKHDLNNDMQVVMGNAELGELLIQSGEDVRKPVSNIAMAAGIAIERIEQLSVFSAVRNSAHEPVDLNAVLRESMTKFAGNIPAIVTLRLELEYLPVRIVMDRHLLSLSLTHLIRQAVQTMQLGGVIVVKTHTVRHGGSAMESAEVFAEMQIVRTLNGDVENSDAALALSSSSHDILEKALLATRALVERSGAVSVSHSIRENESLICMGFDPESIAAPGVEPSIGREHFV